MIRTPSVRNFCYASVVLAVALCFNGFAQDGEKPPTKTEEKPPIRVGVADEDKTGKLPELTTAIGKRAALAFAKKDWKTARKLYAEVLAIDSKNSLALANMGAVTFQLGDYKAAQGHLEKAVAENPKLVQARVTLGMAYYYDENHYLAVSHLTRAVHDQPKNARAHMYLAVVAKHAGWSGAAEEELRKAIAADPDYPEAHYNLALIYLEQNPPVIELARRHYNRALELGAEPNPKMAAKVK
ncbi:MAG: tetratricopeptide (TPR) repeat protein [Verrucomicrobiales bacterium]|jgi:tetratricopeptide (TPR) repeat protein